MDEARLLSLLAEARQQEPAPQASTVLTAHPGALSFARVRALALDPNHWTEAERAHVATCPRCRRLADRCARQFPHPSWWTLLGGLRGHLDPPTSAYLDQHLCDCRFCRDRRAAAADLCAALVVLALPSLGPTGQRRLEFGDPEVCGASSPDGRLHADLVEEHGRLSVRVRTRDPQLAALTFAGRLIGSDGASGPTRFALSRRNALGFDAYFDGRAWPASGPVRGVEIAPADLRFLAADDRAELLESIRLGDAPTRAAWRSCLEPAAAVNPDLCPLLRAASTPGFLVPTLTEPDLVQRARQAGNAE
jgi:hypothetical protein